jgi:alkylated DNA repair dioxygenase AlkB
VCPQLTLFSASTTGPEGLRYLPDFISADEERALVARIRELPLAPFQFGIYEGKRRVASFGWRYDYSHQTLERAEELPPWLSPFIGRVEAFAGLPDSSVSQVVGQAVSQVLCTEYEEGVGIGWHRDKPHFDVIFGLSLASACKFRFRRKTGSETESKMGSETGSKWERFTLEAQPRSLYMMSGESRHAWEHSIPPVDATRYSITFRTMAAKREHARRRTAVRSTDR